MPLQKLSIDKYIHAKGQNKNSVPDLKVSVILEIATLVHFWTTNADLRSIESGLVLLSGSLTNSNISNKHIIFSHKHKLILLPDTFS